MVDLSTLDIVILCASAFFTSVLSAILGMGGGVSLIAVMMQYFPQTALIPMHGIVQMFSNGFRVFLNLKHVKWEIFIPLFLGGILGAAIGSQFVLALPQHYFSLILALLILYLTWKPKPRKGYKKFKHKFFLVGVFANFVSVIFGVSGPLLAPFFLNENLTRFQIIATKAAKQFTGHVLKIIIYLFIGFSLSAYVHLIFLMVLSVIAGTYVGTKVLHKVPEKLFIVLFKGLITLLCFRMLLKAFLGFQ